LVQQNRASGSFWKPVVRQAKADLKGESEVQLPIVPRVVGLDDFSADDEENEEQEQEEEQDEEEVDDQEQFDDQDDDEVQDDDDLDDDDNLDDDDDDDDDRNPNSTADLNDDFFDYDDMEAFADEAEALAERENAGDDADDDDLHLSKRKSKRSRRNNNDNDDFDNDDNADDDDDDNDDESSDDEESLDLMAPVSDEKELASAASLKYSDFFGDEKPRRRNRGSAVGAQDHGDDDDVVDDEFAELREYQRVDNTNRELQRAEAADDDEKPLPGDESSPFELAQRKVAAKIAKMEAALVAERSWALRGEVGAAARPANSLVATEVEYDHATRPAPVITDEHTRTLEDMIRARVRDSAFDDVVRRTEADIEANKRRKRELPELSHEKSKLSLAELYEQDFVAQREQATQTRLGDDGVDAEAVENVGDSLDDQRKEIRQLFDALCARLDALSHYRARPRLFHQEDDVESAKAQPNVAAARLEHALPVAMSTGDTLAPEERFAVQRKAASDVVERPAGAERRARKNAHAAKRSSKPERELSAKEAHAAALKQVRNSANVTVVDKHSKGDVGIDSERGSTALFRQLQREVSGEIASTKKSGASRAAAAAAMATKRSGKAAQFKL
jgi:U3 small nucleolar RNA-associated protein MPP10